MVHTGALHWLKRYQDWLLAGLAVLCALLLHNVDTHTDDTQFPFFMLIGFSFILGLVQPRWPWRWGLIVGAGVALPQLLAALGLYGLPYSANALGALVILLIAVASTYGGAFVRRSVAQPTGV